MQFLQYKILCTIFFSKSKLASSWTTNEIHVIVRLSSIVLTENTRVSDSESSIGNYYRFAPYPSNLPGVSISVR